MNHISRAVLILLSFVLASCVGTPQNVADQATTITMESKETQPHSVEQPIKPIAIDTLYDLLVGDVALGRNQFDIALAELQAVVAGQGASHHRNKQLKALDPLIKDLLPQ